MHIPQITLEQHSNLLSSRVGNCFSFLVSKLVGASQMRMAHVQHASEDMVEYNAVINGLDERKWETFPPLYLLDRG